MKCWNPDDNVGAYTADWVGVSPQSRNLVAWILMCISRKQEFEWMQDRKFELRTVKSLQSCLTLCDPIDGSPPGSPIPGILQARILEWVAISFSNAWKWKVKVKSHSHVWLLATPWTTAYQAPPSMGPSKQEYWSGLPLPSLQRVEQNWNDLIHTHTCGR